MARATVNPVSGVGSYPSTPVSPNTLDLPLTAADSVNKNQAAFGTAARLMLIFMNTHATNPQDVTIETAPDTLNREGDITDYSLAAGEMGFFIAARNGWRQSDGMLYFDGSDPTVKFAVIPL